MKLKSVEVELMIPYSESGLAAKMFDSGTVLSQEYEGEGIRIRARVQNDELSRYEKYLIER